MWVGSHQFQPFCSILRISGVNLEFYVYRERQRFFEYKANKNSEGIITNFQLSKELQDEIPFTKIIDMITYEAQLKGSNVIATEESYTSKWSFLDNETSCKHENY